MNGFVLTIYHVTICGPLHTLLRRPCTQQLAEEDSSITHFSGPFQTLHLQQDTPHFLLRLPWPTGKKYTNEEASPDPRPPTQKIKKDADYRWFRRRGYIMSFSKFTYNVCTLNKALFYVPTTNETYIEFIF